MAKVHHMVNHGVQLDRLFSALSSATRRAILSRLEERDGISVSELAQPLAMKLPAMLKHLDVLERAHLITRAKSGRTVYVHCSAAPMAEAVRWLQRYERFWSASLDRLVAYAEKKALEERKKRS